MSEANNNEKNMMILIVWGAILFSICILFYIGANPNLMPPEKSQIIPYVDQVFAALALIFASISRVFHFKGKRMTDVNKSFTMHIISYALVESIAIYGLILPKLGGLADTQKLLFAVAIIVHFMYFPKDSLSK